MMFLATAWLFTICLSRVASLDVNLETSCWLSTSSPYTQANIEGFCSAFTNCKNSTVCITYPMVNNVSFWCGEIYYSGILNLPTFLTDQGYQASTTLDGTYMAANYDTICDDHCYSILFAENVCFKIGATKCWLEYLGVLPLLGNFLVAKDNPTAPASFSTLATFPVESFCTPCVKPLMKINYPSLDLCIEAPDDKLCFNIYRTALGLILASDVSNPVVFAGLYQNPQICNNCTEIYSTFFNTTSITDPFCVYTDTTTDCIIRAASYVAQNTLNVFCDANPECSGTIVCLFAGGGSCYGVLMSDEPLLQILAASENRPDYVDPAIVPYLPTLCSHICWGALLDMGGGDGGELFCLKIGNSFCFEEYISLQTVIMTIEMETENSCWPNYTLVNNNIEALCSPCMRLINNFTTNVTDESIDDGRCGNTPTSFDSICAQDENGNRCFPKLLTMMSILENTSMSSSWFLNPDICNDCTKLYRSYFNATEQQQYDQLCPSNPDAETICGGKAYPYMAMGPNFVKDFCDTTPECQNTTRCISVNDTLCYQEIDNDFQQGYDLNDPTSLDDVALETICPSPCWRLVLGDEYSNVCLQDSDGTWCVILAYEARNLLEQTAGMEQVEIVSQYMHSPIFCNPCMELYKPVAFNETEIALYNLLCPPTDAPTAVSNTDPPTVNDGGSLYTLSGFLSIVFSLIIFV